MLPQPPQLRLSFCWLTQPSLHRHCPAGQSLQTPFIQSPLHWVGVSGAMGDVRSSSTRRSADGRCVGPGSPRGCRRAARRCRRYTQTAPLGTCIHRYRTSRGTHTASACPNSCLQRSRTRLQFSGSLCVFTHFAEGLNGSSPPQAVWPEGQGVHVPPVQRCVSGHWVSEAWKYAP